jgi:RNA polymerase sigma-70 factor (ECF subfamily)
MSGPGGVGIGKQAKQSAERRNARRVEESDLTARVSVGDHDAFRDLVEVHSHELQVHCYRILGSVQEAEGALQETLVSAWRERPRTASQPPDPALPELTGVSAVPPWLEPYPDILLDGLVDQVPGPGARYGSTEAISLAFITALQLLPPRQRAALVLRDGHDGAGAVRDGPSWATTAPKSPRCSTPPWNP